MMQTNNPNSDLCKYSGLTPPSKPIHASGKYDYLYRWYSPELQRWLNQDPIWEAGGINLYAYVNNSPVYFIDPIGLD